MNYTKINQEAVKSIMDGGKYGFNVPGYWDGEYLIVTFDGFMAFFLPKDKVIFDKEKIKNIGKPFPDLDKVKLWGHEVHLTKTYVESGFSSKSLLRVFKGEKNGKSWKVYIDSKMMKPLLKEECVINFYQDYDVNADMSTKPIFAFLPSGIPLMAMLPVRVFDDTEFD